MCRFVCVLAARLARVMLTETHFLPCVPSGSSDRRLPTDSGPLVTGGDRSAATDPGGERCRPRPRLLIPVQVSPAVTSVNLTREGILSDCDVLYFCLNKSISCSTV